ncbi:hypothetical protein JGU71_19415 [Antrihabitans sp. YC3-6]|uniref:YbjN domain-containing protein n=1 Tax=Antrihabitans stalagmiti TaxID=2799499 RepID=A0A934NTU7_9NOCA|nr:hypothetical protein [Antrihabitans stalagmiti]MBJ8341060.1 hypothetical protein [Antrihabitans stalagmiti]
MADVASFDHEVAHAWTLFRRQLADRVASMVDDDLLVVETAFEQGGPCVQFLGWGGGLVRCEVPSNAFLPDNRQLNGGDEALLVQLGWQPPASGPQGSPAFFADFDATAADRMAIMAVRALREIWNVSHPAFIRVVVGSDDVTSALGVSAAVPEPAGLPPLAAIPAWDQKHLRSLVDQTLAIHNVPADRDEDGDAFVYVNNMVLFTYVHPDTPEVELWAPIVHKVGSKARAAVAILDLNRRWQYIRFTFTKDRVHATIDISGYPFVPQFFYEMVDHFCRFLRSVDAELAHELGGELCSMGEDFVSPEVSSMDPLPAPLLAILELDPEGFGLDPAIVAMACGHDKDTASAYLQICTEQVGTWRESALVARRHADLDEARSCDHEANAWSRTSESLAAAMRLLTQPITHERIGRIRTPRQLELFPNPAEQTLFDEPK